MSGHASVLLAEALQYLAPRSGGWWADLTVGGGGHTEALLRAVAPDGRVLGLDRDADVLERTRERLRPFAERVVLVPADYRDLDSVLRERGIPGLQGAIMDLGVSSFQLDDPERGFSFRLAGPLDMRMDRRQERTAAELINTASEEDLANWFYALGEERRSRRLARAIVRRRPLRTTADLAGIAEQAVGRSGKLHPATRAFQALRIVVNDELAGLEAGLQAARSALTAGGRLVVISFHSLEDRIVKQFLRAGGWNILTKHVVRPSEAESGLNPRSRSARLRAAERLGEN